MSYKKYKCVVCDFVYDEEKGDPDSGLKAGTRFEDIPEDWSCPECGVTKTFLELLD
jgi:rubredoxin